MLAIAVHTLNGQDNLVPYRVNGKFGFFNIATGKIVIPCIYQDVIPFSKKTGGTSWVKYNNSWQLIYTNGKAIFSAAYSEIKFPSETVYPICKNNLWGAVDILGNIISTYKYEDMSRFHFDMAKVKKNGRWGIINNKGSLIIPIEYIDIQIISNNLFAAYVKNEYFCLNKENKFIFKFTGKPEGMYSEGLLKLFCQSSLGARVKYVDMAGEVIIESKYCAGQRFNNGLAAVAKRDKNNIIKWGYINTKDKTIIPFKYEAAAPFDKDSGFAPVKYSGLWGMIDKKNRVIIPFKYEYLGYFKNGLAPIKKNNLWGYINLEGEIVIKPKYDYAFPFKDGFACVYVGNNPGYIDISGNEYWN